MLKWLIKLLIIAIPAIGYGQKDTTKLSFKKYYVPTGIRLGTDLISIVRNYTDDSFSGWEANVDVDLYRYYLTIDYGTWSRSYLRDDRLSYSNDGNYFRIGADVNFLTKDPQRNMFFLGLRYARSNFTEEFYNVETLPDNTITEKLYTNTDIPARWFELTTGVRVKIWKSIWMGYTARFKTALKVGETPEMIPYDIPGYGKADEESYWGFNYQIFFRIPVRKMPPLPPSKKKKK